MTERDKMLAGELYDATGPELTSERQRARELTRRFNVEPNGARREEVLRQLLAHVGDGVLVEPPFRCDYGWNITLEDGAFLNFECVILDCAPVRIGRRALLAPGVHLYTATHPIDVEVRRSGLELALPITIGDDVWLGGRAVVLPGVTIGDGAVVGAGSVVVGDVAPGAVVAGNPARPVRAGG